MAITPREEMVMDRWDAGISASQIARESLSVPYIRRVVCNLNVSDPSNRRARKAMQRGSAALLKAIEQERRI